MQAEQRILRVLKHWVHPPPSAAGGSLDVRQLKLERAGIKNQAPMALVFRPYTPAVRPMTREAFEVARKT